MMFVGLRMLKIRNVLSSSKSGVACMSGASELDRKSRAVLSPTIPYTDDRLGLDSCKVPISSRENLLVTQQLLGLGPIRPRNSPCLHEMEKPGQAANCRVNRRTRLCARKEDRPLHSDGPPARKIWCTNRFVITTYIKSRLRCYCAQNSSRLLSKVEETAITFLGSIRQDLSHGTARDRLGPVTELRNYRWPRIGELEERSSDANSYLSKPSTC